MVAWRGGWWLQLLRLAVFGFCLWRGIRVLGLLLLHPHVCIQASFEQQLIVSEKEGRFNKEDALWVTVQINEEHLPSLLGDAAIADNQDLVCSNDGGQPLIFTKESGSSVKTMDLIRKTTFVYASHLWATTTVVRLAQTLFREAWMLRSVWVSRADVACRENRF